ncbi:TIGR03086 family metal-binding protein [Spirillospora albida]|uniref:TIGR03086 family metal-binding protein n=1 Tax=Spirillospora albida TaxID=58123 RepID=UPI0006904DA9|nr:TIGR03086 family metal-binding protein [Spirillospora albida]
MSEHTDALATALRQASDVISRVRPEQAALPTPCGSWKVRALVNHVVDEVGQFAAVTDGGERDHRGSDLLGDDWTAAFDASAEALLEAWSRPDALNRTHRLPFGEVPAAWAIEQHLTEIAIHTWDIAKATGQPTELDPAVGAVAMRWAQENLLPQYRGDEASGAHIGSEIPVPPDAPLYDRLAAFGGRNPR